MTDYRHAEQLELGLDLREPVPAPWWSELIQQRGGGVRESRWPCAPRGWSRIDQGELGRRTAMRTFNHLHLSRKDPTMQRTISRLAVPLAGALLIAGCSSPNDSAEPAGVEQQTVASDGGADAPMDDGGDDEAVDETEAWPIVEDENGNIEENPAGASDGGGGDEEYIEGVVNPGEWGTYSTIGMGLPKGEGEISIRVADAECGLATIPDGAENPVYMESGGEEGEATIDAEAPEGKEFCIFSMEYENVGKAPYQVDEPGAVMLEDGEVHEQSTEDQDIAWRIQDYVIDLNPGDKGEYKHIVSIPAGQVPAALFYPQETAVATSSMVFFL